MIEARDLSKHYGGKRAVDHLSFTVPPGKVTGFLGPNGAGKSTTMRLLLGLDRADTGSATIDGKPYRDLANRCGSWVPCWRPEPSTLVAAPTTICSSLPRLRACPAAASRK